MKIHKKNVKSALDIHLLELVRLRIGYLNECPYSIGLHYKELKNLGETDFRLSLVAVWNEVPCFSEKERALFSLADYIIMPNEKFSIHLIQLALTQYFDKGEIFRLTKAIKQIHLWTCSMKYSSSIPI